MTSLDAQLLAAHEANNRPELVRLYTQASEVSEDEDARGFYLTHAFVYALDAGMQEAMDLQKQLIELGREDPNCFLLIE